jgi:hypothetical protein
MFLWLRNVLLYIVAAIASVAVVNWLNSDVIEQTLLPSLTGTIIALLAINVATTASVAVKLREIGDKHGVDFSATAREFRIAIGEQTAFIIISLLLVALHTAKPIPCSIVSLDICAMAVFYASLHVFVDTSLSLILVLFPSSNA